MGMVVFSRHGCDSSLAGRLSIDHSYVSFLSVCHACMFRSEPYEFFDRTLHSAGDGRSFCMAHFSCGLGTIGSVGFFLLGFG